MLSKTLLLCSVLHQLDQKIIYPHYDFKHLTEKYFEIGMKLDDFLIQLVKYCIFAIPASAAVGSANLKVTIIETNPYPAKIGEYLYLTLQVENIGGDKTPDVDIRIVPSYPFSLDSEANTVKNVGVLNPGSTATKEFSLFVDKSAQKGIRSLRACLKIQPDLTIGIELH